MAIAPELHASFATVYKTVGNCVISTDVYLPKDVEGEPKERPVVIIVHGGSFIVGTSLMQSMVQIQDCLDRGWIVLSPDHRLCPQVKIHEGPIADIRDLLRWAVAGDKGLDGQMEIHASKLRVNKDKIVAMGTSSGGTCAESLAWGDDLPPIAALVSSYGAKGFLGRNWAERLANKEVSTPVFFEALLKEDPIPTRCLSPMEWLRMDKKVPLTASEKGRHEMIMRMRKDFNANFQVIEMIFPSWEELHLVDSTMNVNEKTKKRWPPTWLMHGTEDPGVSIEVSRKLNNILHEAGIQCKLTEFEGEGHAFIAAMEKGDAVYEKQKKVLDEVDEYLKSL